MSNNEMGFGIIGCGMIANFHATALADVEGARLVGAADHSSVQHHLFS